MCFIGARTRSRRPRRNHSQGQTMGGVRYDRNTPFALRPHTQLQLLLPSSSLIKISLSVRQPLGNEDPVLPRVPNNVSRLMEPNKETYERLPCKVASTQLLTPSPLPRQTLSSVHRRCENFIILIHFNNPPPIWQECVRDHAPNQRRDTLSILGNKLTWKIPSLVKQLFLSTSFL